MSVASNRHTDIGFRRIVVVNSGSSGQVALFVDFENLAGGDENGSSGTLHAERLVTFAEKYGRVVISKAYANWNNPMYGEHQRNIYECGIEPVQVLGQAGKNSADIKLAVDAIDMMRYLPHINVFIIVSSDKDFIHLNKILRAQGKIVICVGLNPNPTLAGSCDQYKLYESIAKTEVGEKKASVAKVGEKEASVAKVGEKEASVAKVGEKEAGDADLTPVKQALQEMITEYPHGIFASEVKGLLCEKLFTNFDEKKYGFKGFEQLLNALKDVVEIKKSPDNKELLVYSSDSAVKGLDISKLMMIQAITKNLLHFIPHAEKRRNTLKIIFAVIKQQQPFLWEEILERIAKMEKTVSISDGYVSNVLDDIFLEYGFYWENSQNHLLRGERSISLRKDIDTEDAFVRIYEQRIAFLLRRLVDDKQELSASLLVTILNLPKDEENLAYCQSLLDSSVDNSSAVLVQKLIYRINQFEQNADKRHKFLKLIFVAIKQQQPFCLKEIEERIAKMEAKDIPIHIVHDHLLKINIEKGFSWAKHQKTVSLQDRMMSLQEKIDSEDAFIRIYEQHIVFNLRKLLSDEQRLSASLLAEILGFTPEDEKKQAYCQSLLGDLAPADTVSTDGVAREATAPGDATAEDISPKTSSYTTEDK